MPLERSELREDFQPIHACPVAASHRNEVKRFKVKSDKLSISAGAASDKARPWARLASIGAALRWRWHEGRITCAVFSLAAGAAAPAPTVKAALRCRARAVPRARGFFVLASRANGQGQIQSDLSKEEKKRGFALLQGVLPKSEAPSITSPVSGRGG